MRFKLFAVCIVSLVAGCGDDAEERNYSESTDGVVVTPKSGAAKQVRLQVISDRIVRVTATPQESINVPSSLMVIAKPAAPGAFAIESTADTVSVKTKHLIAKVSVASGVVSFVNADGKPVLIERGRGDFRAINIDGSQYYEIQQRFNPDTDEGIYGLGQHQNAQMNYNGEDVLLAQHNMDVAVPFFVSTRNYGLLWDNNSITRFGDGRPYGFLSRDLEVFDAEGKRGGLTARYYVDGKQKMTRVERDINYQYIKDLAKRPEEMLGKSISHTSAQRVDIEKASVTWEGTIQSDKPGLHKFKLYSSNYFKLFIDDRKVLDGWRQNWNPWYHNFTVDMAANKPVKVRVEWIPNNGHIALLHNDPLPESRQKEISLSSEAAHAIDYYFVAGNSMDEVIAGYRALTGKAVMLPKWAYGFWQSRQRYTSQQELIDVVKEYRKRRIPIDNIVQDGFYWRENEWGSHRFDPARFPDPKQLVDDLHDLNARVMISVWPKFYDTTDNYKELAAKGFMYAANIKAGAKDWVGPGYASSFYDPYSAEARQIYWRQIKDNLDVHGFDAWRLDATEPDLHSNLDIDEIKTRIGPTKRGPAMVYFNSYPLPHTQGVYDGARAAHPDKRPFILTRSAFGGVQRNGAATWSGDIASRWDDLLNQISAGVNFSMSGLPNWSFDIGGFAPENRFLQPNSKDLEEWRELNLRWFQFGAFVPLFHSHGEAPFREIYNLAPANTEVYQSLVWYDELRYRLLPYIYTVGADTFHRDYTMMRGMVMDFPNDEKVRGINDQYLFGPSLLVAPVYEFKARSRKVYLPAGPSWYDFYTGAVHAGGQEIDAAAPLSRMPLFVKAGSIIPIGPVIQHTAEGRGADVTLQVYPGANGALGLYEDDGVSMGYERNEFARIPLSYDEATRTLTIGARAGAYPGMIEKRTFHIRWMADPGQPDKREPLNFDSTDQTIEYAGQALIVKR
jgi:alpha-D-xyloside xylohydrolase